MNSFTGIFQGFYLNFKNTVLTPHAPFMYWLKSPIKLWRVPLLIRGCSPHILNPCGKPWFKWSRKKRKRNVSSNKTAFSRERKEILAASDKGSYYNQELLVKEYEKSGIEGLGNCRSKFDLHKETIDESQNESDLISELVSNTEEQTENLKQTSHHFAVDFQELQKYLTVAAVCS